MKEKKTEKEAEKKKAEKMTFQLEKHRLQLQVKGNKYCQVSVKSSTEFNTKVELKKINA